MHDYLFDVAVVRVAIVVGVIITTLFYERFQLTTGGAIVPGYLALFIPAPTFILMTLLTSYVTYYVVNSLIARRYILYGRRKYEMEILVSLILVTVWFGVAHLVVPFNPMLVALYGIGFVIPAVIAHDVFRQGARKTYLAVLINIGLIGLFVYVFSSLNRISPWYSGSDARGFDVGPLAYPADLLLPAIFVSVLAGMVIFRRLGLRTGGFVIGAYVGLMLLRPLDLLFVIVVSCLAYLFVTRILMHHMLIFGRRKLGMMILVAAIFAWVGEIVITVTTGGTVVPWEGFNVITLMVPALIANDAQRQGMYRTLWGAGLTALAVFTSMNLLGAGLVYFGVMS